MKNIKLNCNYIDGIIYGYWTADDKVVTNTQDYSGRSLNETVDLFMAVHFPKHSVKMTTCNGTMVQQVYVDMDGSNPLDLRITESFMCSNGGSPNAPYFTLATFKVSNMAVFKTIAHMQTVPAVKDYMALEEKRYGQQTEDFVWPIQIDEDFQPHLTFSGKVVLNSQQESFGLGSVLFVDEKGQTKHSQIERSPMVMDQDKPKPPTLLNKLKKFFS